MSDHKGKIRCATCFYSAPKRAPFLCDYVAITGHTRLDQPPEECTHYVPAKKRRPHRKAAEEAAGIKRTKPEESEVNQ